MEYEQGKHATLKTTPGSVELSRVETFYRDMELNVPVRCPEIVLTHPIDNPFPSGRKVVGIGLRSTERWRDWSYHRWFQLAKALQRAGYFVVTFDAKEILDGIPGISNVPLEVAVAHLAHLDAFIGVDSGLTYMAAGLGVTTFGLYGETNGKTLLEKHYHDGHAIQLLRPDRCKRPCYLLKSRNFYCNQMNMEDVASVCMHEISVEEVLKQFLSVSSRTKLGEHRLYR